MATAATKPDIAVEDWTDTGSEPQEEEAGGTKGTGAGIRKQTSYRWAIFQIVEASSKAHSFCLKRDQNWQLIQFIDERVSSIRSIVLLRN